MTRFIARRQNMPKDSEGFQRMLARIYPNNNLSDSVDHFVQEAAEVGDEIGRIRRLSSPTQPYPRDELALEIADALANLFAIASCAGHSLGTLVSRMYENGCPGCNLMGCGCGPRFSIQTVGTMVVPLEA